MGAPSVTTTGRALLLKALRAIKRHPRSFSMSTYMSHDLIRPPSKEMPEPYCGTIACIAGHVVLAAGYPAGMAWNYDEARLPARQRRQLRAITRSSGYTPDIGELATSLLTGSLL